MNPVISCVVVVCGKVCGTQGLTSMIYQLKNQTYKNIEIVPVSCCADSLDFVATLTDVRSKNFEHSGSYEKCNYGIEAATGDYIGFFAGDDFYMPNYLEKMVAAIDSQDADLVCCDFYSHYRQDGSVAPAALEMGHITTGSFLLRSSIAKKYRIPITLVGDIEFLGDIYTHEPNLKVGYVHEGIYLHR
jgi:glycosyltransferase involved in cell wall biosynthesis